MRPNDRPCPKCGAKYEPMEGFDNVVVKHHASWCKFDLVASVTEPEKPMGVWRGALLWMAVFLVVFLFWVGVGTAISWLR